MNTRKYAREKVDLGLVLAVIAAGLNMGSCEFVATLAHHFNCSERAANDALAVLRRGGYVDAERDERDGRRRRFLVTERGARLAFAPYGWLILRLARRLFTTCPSPGVATAQRALSEQQRQERLVHAEARLLGSEAA